MIYDLDDYSNINEQRKAFAKIQIDIEADKGPYHPENLPIGSYMVDVYIDEDEEHLRDIRRRLKLKREKIQVHIKKHDPTQWLWITEKDDRLSRFQFIQLIKHLKLRFQCKLQYHKDGQPIWTYNTTEEELKKEIETFI